MFGLRQKPGVGFFKDQNCSVVLLCHSSLIKVVVHEGNVRSQKDDLQANLGNSRGYQSDSFEVRCARQVYRQLENEISSWGNLSGLLPQKAC